MAIAEALTSTSSTANQLLMMHKLPPVHSTMNIRRPNLSSHILMQSEKLSAGFQLPMAPRTPIEGLRQLQLASAPQLSPTESRRFGDSVASMSQDSASLATTPVPRLPSIQSRFAAQTQNAHQVKDLAARLALLLHARECCKGDAVCDVPNCSIARGVLDHCQECFLGDGECHASCSQAKHLLRHFRICRAQNFPESCQVCGMLRAEFSWAMQHSESLTTLFLQNQNQQPSPQSSTGSSSFSPSSFGPVSLRRVVSDDPSLRGRSPTALPLYPTKRPRFNQHARVQGGDGNGDSSVHEAAPAAAAALHCHPADAARAAQHHLLELESPRIVQDPRSDVQHPVGVLVLVSFDLSWAGVVKINEEFAYFVSSRTFVSPLEIMLISVGVTRWKSFEIAHILDTKWKGEHQRVHDYMSFPGCTTHGSVFDGALDFRHGTLYDVFLIVYNPLFEVIGFSVLFTAAYLVVKGVVFYLYLRRRQRQTMPYDTKGNGLHGREHDEYHRLAIELLLDFPMRAV